MLARLIGLVAWLVIPAACRAQLWDTFSFNRACSLRTGVKPFSIDLRCTKVATSVPTPVGITIFVDQKVTYEAFFCNLELKSVKKLGVMVKIHAGEYDRYTQPSGRVR